MTDNFSDIILPIANVLVVVGPGVVLLLLVWAFVSCGFQPDSKKGD